MNTNFGRYNCRRDPRSFFRRPPPPPSESDDNNVEPKKPAKKKPTAVRHLILIRHGQYNLNGEHDGERVLTPLGREQAALTGKRLKELGLEYDSIVCSNMSRAIETADLIKENLKQADLKVEPNDPLLREGAPALPEPPVSHWHPDLHVRRLKLNFALEIF